MGFVENLILFETVQKLWKSVNIWQDKVITYYVMSGFLWITVYIDRDYKLNLSFTRRRSDISKAKWQI